MHDPTIPSEPSIQKGICFVLFAYDTALSINLDDAERRIHDATQRDTIRHKRRAPSYFEYQPPLLRITQTVNRLTSALTKAARTSIWLSMTSARCRSYTAFRSMGGSPICSA